MYQERIKTDRREDLDRDVHIRTEKEQEGGLEETKENQEEIPQLTGRWIDDRGNRKIKCL